MRGRNRIAIGLFFAKYGLLFMPFTEGSVTESLLYAMVAAALFGLAAAAAFVPAVRATRIDPIEALRHE